MLFGVFDGHGGKDVAQYAYDNLKDKFVSDKEFKRGNYKEALRNSFLKVDDSL